MFNVKDNCFAYVKKKDSCSLLKEDNCLNCKFYMTSKEYLEKISSLEKEKISVKEK